MEFKKKSNSSLILLIEFWITSFYFTFTFLASNSHPIFYQVSISHRPHYNHKNNWTDRSAFKWELSLREVSADTLSYCGQLKGKEALEMASRALLFELQKIVCDFAFKGKNKVLWNDAFRPVDCVRFFFTYLQPILWVIIGVNLEPEQKKNCVLFLLWDGQLKRGVNRTETI